ncbi:hypothetical protein PG997_007881 [Apiospora hydei]|uniref:Uncharacterized protein n=1 Tax=Apiospora hydei TaxID=1337664 RepID=A0ABR1W9A5_9PEZI
MLKSKMLQSHYGPSLLTLTSFVRSPTSNTISRQPLSTPDLLVTRCIFTTNHKNLVHEDTSNTHASSSYPLSPGTSSISLEYKKACAWFPQQQLPGASSYTFVLQVQGPGVLKTHKSETKLPTIDTPTHFFSHSLLFLLNPLIPYPNPAQANKRTSGEMVTCRIPVIFYIGCLPPFDIQFRPGLCEGARSKILFNDDLGSDCPVAAAARPLDSEEEMPPGYNEQAAPKKQALHQPGSLKV